MLIFLFTPVSLNDVLSVGIIPFLLSFIATMIRIFLQAIRFYYFVRKFIGKNVSTFWKIIFARLAGEFVTQTTPSYVGGELVRIAFLTKNNVSAGKAAWVTTMEIIADVFVGTILAFIAGFNAIIQGAAFIGILLIMRFSPLAWINLSDNFLLYFKDINPSCIQFMLAPESIKAISVKENFIDY